MGGLGIELWLRDDEETKTGIEAKVKKTVAIA